MERRRKNQNRGEKVETEGKNPWRGKIPGGEKWSEKIPGGEKSERKKLTFAPWRGKIPGGENSADSSIPQDITSSALDIGLYVR